MRGVEAVEKLENEATSRLPQFVLDFVDADRAPRLRQRRRTCGRFEAESGDDAGLNTIVSYIASPWKRSRHGGFSTGSLDVTEMVSLKDTLIIQFRCSGDLSEFDWLVGIEDALIQGFSQNSKAVVDGHDFGAGTMNIFLFPKQGWGSAIEIVKAYLKLHKALDRALIIKRSKTERYSVVWPEGYAGDFERL